MAPSTGCAHRDSIHPRASPRCWATRNNGPLGHQARRCASDGQSDVPRRDDDPRDAVHDGDGSRDGRRLHGARTDGRGGRPDRVRRQRHGGNDDRGRDPFRLRCDGAVGESPPRRSIARDRGTGPAGAAHADRVDGRGQANRRGVLGERRASGAVRARAQSVAPRPGAGRRSVSPSSPRPSSFWTTWGIAHRVPVCRRARDHHALAADSQGADLCTDGRHRRGTDDELAGDTRRRAELGLSVLLAARCDALAARADERRVLRGSDRVGGTG